MFRVAAILLAGAAGVMLTAQERFAPARYRAGPVPALPVMAVGGGKVFLEVDVSADGRVTAVIPLSTTPPFTSLMVDAVRQWAFFPAEEREGAVGTPVASKVFVAAMFRPPSLNAPTLGEIPEDVASASAETAWPLAVTMPPYPPAAHSSGVVLLEARVEPDGSVAAVSVIQPAPPFDDAARAAARQWRFRPARAGGRPVPARVYLVFGFPVPVVNSNSP